MLRKKSYNTGFQRMHAISVTVLATSRGLQAVRRQRWRLPFCITVTVVLTCPPRRVPGVTIGVASITSLETPSPRLRMLRRSILQL